MIIRFILSISILSVLLTFCTKPEVATTIHYAEIRDFSPKDTLFRIPSEEYYVGDDAGFVNQKGDTVFPIGAFELSFSEQIITYGIVMTNAEEGSEFIGINQQGERLFEVYLFDNGPDYIIEGMFRIRQNGKIGFADSTGKVVIPAQFECASQFWEGKAKVTFDCEPAPSDGHDEHREMISDEWFYIDKTGARIN